ncbi:MAG: hypothetical protein HY858_14380 [Candidatus Solibacter usitatus]|nr:hypothetical protein [Candidatus Solibacter usitatus]
MLYSFKRAIAIVALGSLGLAAAWAQAPQKQWKDRAEYDLVQTINKEQNAQTKLGLLNQWKEKYPASDFKDERYAQIIAAYQALGNAKGMLDTAKEQVAADPKSFAGLYYINLLTLSMNDASEPALALGERAAAGLLSILDDTYSPARKPPQSSDDDWKKQRVSMEATAYRTMGWIDLQRKKNDEAVTHLTEVLKRNPADSQSSVWLAQACIRTRKIELQSPALFHFARAAVYDGPGAFPQQYRDQLRKNFEKNYVAVHGDNNGMEEVINLAKASALPPDNFKIESKDEILIKQEEQLKKTNPMLALWISIKRELSGANGQAYYEASLKDAHIPGGAPVGDTKVEKFKARIVDCDAPKKAKKIVVGISAPDMREVTLALETPLAVCPDKGTEVEFSGVPSEFSAEPFNVTFSVENKDVSGLPLPAAPVKAAPKKAPAAPVKKAAPKK